MVLIIHYGYQINYICEQHMVNAIPLQHTKIAKNLQDMI